jgi:hypothetical protein
MNYACRVFPKCLEKHRSILNISREAHTGQLPIVWLTSPKSSGQFKGTKTKGSRETYLILGNICNTREHIQRYREPHIILEIISNTTEPCLILGTHT